MAIHASSRPTSEEVLGLRLASKRACEGAGDGHRACGRSQGGPQTPETLPSQKPRPEARASQTSVSAIDSVSSSADEGRISLPPRFVIRSLYTCEHLLCAVPSPVSPHHMDPAGAGTGQQCSPSHTGTQCGPVPMLSHLLERVLCSGWGWPERLQEEETSVPKSESLGDDVRQAKGLIVHVRMLQKIRSTRQGDVIITEAVAKAPASGLSRVV